MSFAKPDMVLQNDARNYVSINPVIKSIDTTSCVVLRGHVWLRKALEPEGRVVDSGTTSWSPSFMQCKIIHDKMTTNVYHLKHVTLGTIPYLFIISSFV